MTLMVLMTNGYKKPVSQQLWTFTSWIRHTIKRSRHRGETAQAGLEVSEPREFRIGRVRFEANAAEQVLLTRPS